MKKYRIREFSPLWWVRGFVITGIAMVLIGGIPTEIEKTTTVPAYAETEVAYEPSLQEKIVLEAKENGIDTDLALAISTLETGNFTSDGLWECNNVGGLKVDGEIVVYRSVGDGITSYINTLKNIGTDDLDKLAEVYCPHDPVGWSKAVRELC